MLRAPAVLLCLLASSAIACGDSGETTPCNSTDALTLARPSLVRVQVFGSGGTGIIVGRDLVLTNSHVLGNARRAVVDTAISRETGAVVYRSSTLDLALLRVSTNELARLNLGNAPTPSVGARLTAVGFGGLDEQPTVRSVSYVGQRTIDGDVLLEITPSLHAGNSGGPLLDECGRVAGINTFGSASGYGYAIRAEDAAALVVEYSATLQ
jgi:S1-C subfamily serine protease